MKKSEYEQFSYRSEKEDASLTNATCSTSWSSDVEGKSEIIEYYSAIRRKRIEHGLHFNKQRM